jgi:hypothetical protein
VVELASIAMACESWMLLAIEGVPSEMDRVMPIGKMALMAKAATTAPPFRGAGVRPPAGRSHARS